jgi:hypothetical protein
MFKPKSEGNRLFEVLFLYISLAGGLFASLNSLHHYPLPGHSPNQKSSHKAVSELPSWSQALSIWRRGASNYGRDMTSSLPLTYWSPGSHIWLPTAQLQPLHSYQD